MTDAGFIGKIDAPFICLTAAMLCHSVHAGGLGSVSIKWLSRVLMPEVR